MAVTAPDLGGTGTSEECWRASGVLDGLASCPPSELRPARRVVVVAPHPDDEVLGLGGCLAAWAAIGLPLLVVGVTAGEGSHPDSPTLEPAELVARRRQERTRALEALGAVDAQVVELEIPDGAVGTHRVRLEVALTDLVRDGDTLVAPVDDDGHPDHDATAVATARAAAACGVPLLRYAVWLWHWATPAEPGIDWTSATRVVLPAECRDAKREAVECFETQVEALSEDPRDAAVLPPPVLERLLRDVEIVWGPA